MQGAGNFCLQLAETQLNCNARMPSKERLCQHFPEERLQLSSKRMFSRCNFAKAACKCEAGFSTNFNFSLET